MRVLTRMWLIGLCGVCLPTCWVRKEVGERMQADLIALQTEFEVVRKAHGEEKVELQKRIQEADTSIGKLQGLIEEYRRATGRNAADIGVDLERLQGQLKELRGQLDVALHRLEGVERKISGVKTDLESQKTEGNKTKERELETRDKLQKTEARAAEPLQAIQRPDKPTDFYKLAQTLMENHQSKAARNLFQEFLEKWPDSGYSDNALYWIGETHFQEKNYREAALVFQEVRAKYPKSDKAADALFKLGFCFFQLDLHKEALPFFKQFVQDYPKNTNVEAAKKKITEIEKKGKK